MTEYLKDEIPAVYQQLRDLEGEKNRIKYVFRLETEMCVLFEKFLPQQIETMLRGMNSKGFLLTASMTVVK